MNLPIGFSLTPKQRNFCHYYIETLGNGPQAAKRAYNCKTWGSARVMAHKLLHNPKIKDYLLVLVLEHPAPEEGVIQVMNDAFDACLVVNGRLTPLPDWGVRFKAARLVRDILLGSQDGAGRRAPSAPFQPVKLAPESLSMLSSILERHRGPTPEESSELPK